MDRSKRLKERKATDSTKERKAALKKKRRPTEANPWVDKRVKAKPKKKKNKIPKAAPPVFFAGPLFYGTSSSPQRSLTPLPRSSTLTPKPGPTQNPMASIERCVWPRKTRRGRQRSELTCSPWRTRRLVPLQSVRTFPFLKCLLIGAAAFDAIQGYRMVRAAYGAHEGCWFFEVVINQHSGNTRCVGRPMVARPFPLCWC